MVFKEQVLCLMVLSYYSGVNEGKNRSLTGEKKDPYDVAKHIIDLYDAYGTNVMKICEKEKCDEFESK